MKYIIPYRIFESSYYENLKSEVMEILSDLTDNDYGFSIDLTDKMEFIAVNITHRSPNYFKISDVDKSVQMLFNQLSDRYKFKVFSLLINGKIFDMIYDSNYLISFDRYYFPKEWNIKDNNDIGISILEIHLHKS